MAGQYTNMIRELVYQSDLNNYLVNDVNNYCYDIENDTTGIKERHLQRVTDKYTNEQFWPTYNYFDGTQLINSLFSKIVIPVEFIKGRFYKVEGKNYHTIDTLLEDVSEDDYKTCKKIIEKLKENKKLINTYTMNINVYGFFTNIRNALCHSGNGQLHFFPDDNNGNNITDIYFYDEENSKDKNKCFLLKINIENELIPLVAAFDRIVIMLVDNNAHPYSMDIIFDRVKGITERDIPDQLR